MNLLSGSRHENTPPAQHTKPKLHVDYRSEGHDPVTIASSAREPLDGTRKFLSNNRHWKDSGSNGNGQGQALSPG